MKTKRIVSLILVFTLILSISVSTAFADGWGNGKVPPGIAKKIFGDLDNFSWAQKAIEKMAQKGLLNGYGDGKFKPQGAVTKLEAVIMSLRIMGWEEEAVAIRDLPKNYKGKKVENWAKGYVTIAYEKGILDDVDMMYFNPSDQAKRHEVAKYVIRALGYEDEAQDNMNKKLPFTDAALVPNGSIGYVYLVNDMELMTGDDKDRFNPLGNMTRAEMAVLFSRLDEKVDSDINDSEVIGEVYRIDDDYITLSVDGKTKKYEVDEDDVIVYDEDGRIDYDDIRKGDTVRLELDDDEVVYIEIIEDLDEIDDKIISKYTGEVRNIKTTSPRAIAIDIKEMQVVFQVISGVEVVFENEDGAFDDIEVGDEVSVLVDKENRARKIYVHRDIEDEENIVLEGTIRYISDDAMSIRTSKATYSYSIDRRVEVELDGKEADIDDLEVGMEVKVEVENNKIVLIEAESVELVLEGEIDGIITTSKKTSLIIYADKKSHEYEISEDVELEIEDIRRPTIDDLEIGQEGTFYIQDDIIVEIKIED